MAGPSPHLTWAELACKDGTPYPEAWRAYRAVVLADVFEVLRAACGGRPLRVLSAYRTPAHNRAIGGAPKSHHLHGRALDLAPPAGMTMEGFWVYVRTLAEDDVRIGGVGRYRTFAHLDIRPRTSGRLAVWTGTGVKDATT